MLPNEIQGITKETSKKSNRKTTEIYKRGFYNWIEKELPNDPYNKNDGIVKAVKIEGYQVYKKRFSSSMAIFTIKDDIIIVEIHKFQSRGQIYKK